MLKVAFIPWEEIRPCPVRGCCCLEVSKLPTEEELEELFKTSPSLVVRCIEHLSRRLRRLTKDYLEACEMVSKMDRAEKTDISLTVAEEALIRELADAASRYDAWM